MSSLLLQRVRRFLDDEVGLPSGTRMVVGVSGGADSMVTLDVLHRLGYNVVAAHVHYGLRPEADDEANTVATWCATHAVPFQMRRCNPSQRADREATSVQAAARDQRYAFFADVAAETDAAAVAVGHHRDDQAETVLLHLMRGTGIDGLAGMPPVRPLAPNAAVLLVRPLLRERRATIETYATDRGVPWHRDASNRNPSYQRGCVRTRVLPALNDCAPGTTDTMARTAELVRGYVETTFDPALQRRFARCHASRSDGGWLDVHVLRTFPAVWRGRLLVAALRHDVPSVSPSRALIREIEGLLDAQVGRCVNIGGATIWRERGGLRLCPAAARPPSNWTVTLSPGTDVVLPTGGRLRADLRSHRPPTLHPGTPHIIYADADRLTHPLTVRPWRDGDRMRPLGMSGTKLVSDVLTDAHVPPHRRAHVPVVIDGEQVVWVVGHRMAHSVRIRPATDRIVRLSFEPDENA